MQFRVVRMLLATCLLVLTTIALAPAAVANREHDSSFCATPVKPVKSAYFYYGQNQAAADVDAQPFTHVYYAFALMDSATYRVVPSADDGGRMYNFSATLRKSNPNVKTLLSIGGGGSDASAFSAMVASSATRTAFIQHSIAVARLYSFDGLDLDWEFPQSETDMAKLGLLFSEWRAAVLQENAASPLLLTAAVKYNVTVVFGGAGTYPVDSIARNLDWINIMSYDLHGGWEAETGEHTALYDATELQTLTVNFGVQHWLKAGLPPYRATLGLAAYGRAWYLVDPAQQHGVGAPAAGGAPTPTFSEIRLTSQANNASCAHDRVTRCAYCFYTIPTPATTASSNQSSQSVWVGFDDPFTIAAKVRYLKSLRLRGYAFWSVGGDTAGLLFKQASRSLSTS